MFDPAARRWLFDLPAEKGSSQSATSGFNRPTVGHQERPASPKLIRRIALICGGSPRFSGNDHEALRGRGGNCANSHLTARDDPGGRSGKLWKMTKLSFLVYLICVIAHIEAINDRIFSRSRGRRRSARQRRRYPGEARGCQVEYSSFALSCCLNFHRLPERLAGT